MTDSNYIAPSIVAHAISILHDYIGGTIHKA